MIYQGVSGTVRYSVWNEREGDMDKECTECGGMLIGKDKRHHSGLCIACRKDREKDLDRRNKRRNSVKRRLNPFGDETA